jgi:hypothetical protein
MTRSKNISAMAVAVALGLATGQVFFNADQWFQIQREYEGNDEGRRTHPFGKPKITEISSMPKNKRNAARNRGQTNTIGKGIKAPGWRGVRHVALARGSAVQRWFGGRQVCLPHGPRLQGAIHHSPYHIGGASCSLSNIYITKSSTSISMSVPTNGM